MPATTRSCRSLLLLALLALVLATAGCGKRGALYLPAPGQDEISSDTNGETAKEGDETPPAPGT